LINKSGKDFSEVMEYMKNLGLSDLAEKYKDLSVKVMEHELNRYIPIFRTLPRATSTLMPMPMPTPSSVGFSNTQLAMDVDSLDEDFFGSSGTDEPADSVWEWDEDGYAHV
jgi:hypothetical protein